MDELTGHGGLDPKAAGYYRALRQRQRRFQIEILIAACFICLIAGFIAGASWHYMKLRGEKPVIVVEPAAEPPPDPGPVKGQIRV